VKEVGWLLAPVLGNQADQGHGGNDQPEPYIAVMRKGLPQEANELDQTSE